MAGRRAIIVFVVLLALGALVSVGLHRVDWKATKPKREEGVAKRIVCMSPAVTECVFALGCGDRVVGVSSFSTYPPEAREKKNVGGFIDLSFETLIALKPDLVITQGHAENLAELCQRAGIRLRQLEVTTVEVILSDLQALGDELGAGERAEQLCREIRGELDEAAGQVANQQRRRVFFCIGRAPGTLSGMYTIGASSLFLRELLGIAGGENIFADVERGYPQVSKEALVKRQPEVIIEVHPGEELSVEQEEALRRDWQGLAMLPAVENNRVYLPTDDHLLIPGPRIGQTAKRLAELIHQL